MSKRTAPVNLPTLAPRVDAWVWFGYYYFGGDIADLGVAACGANR